MTAPRKPTDRKPAARKPAPKSGHEVVNDVLTWHTKAGATIRIDLDIPAHILESSVADTPEGDPDDETQVRFVLDWIGQDAVDAYEKMGILERTRFVTTFFGEFTKAVGLARGEFVSSLPSAGSTAPSSDSTSGVASDSPSTVLE